jgi:hypothetical protein
VRLFPGIWMVIFVGDDAPQVSETDKASMIDIRAGIAIALRRNVSGYAKDILDLTLPLRGFISFIAAPPLFGSDPRRYYKTRIKQQT